jgi:TonB-dependent receptor
LSRLAKSGASLIAIAVACGSTAALAQSIAVTGAATQDTSPDPAGSAVEESATPSGAEVVVVGTRQSQQSAINRKKRARTATDSIVADDIGSFPDRNVSEAMSRIPGVALSRNDFGEGEGVSVRGNTMDLTRVELDGIGVQSTNALAIQPGNGASRTADLRELPAELVKSIDVVKGSTADMTEGSIGGGIQIKTRSGLDFKKPFLQIRVGAQRNSLGLKTTPEGSVVAANKFLGDRLGVILSGTYNHIQTNSHAIENTTSNNRGFARLYDFDQSPEKTFTFNPSTVGTDEADVPFANSRQADGSALTPRELVTLAAGAASKAECFTLFPNNPTGNTAGATLAVQNAQRGQRMLEQQTCLNQWNDYTPSLIRHFMNSQEDKRIGLDARVDYKVTDNLTVFGKVSQLNRKTDDQNRGRTPVTLFNANPAGSFVDTTTGYPRRRSVAPNAPAGYFLYDPLFGLNNVATGTGNTAVNNAVTGNVLNVIPGSIVVDDAHNVTQMTTTNNSVQIDQISNVNNTKTRYAQLGAEYRGSRIDIDAVAGMTKASSTRGDMRTNRTYTYGEATLTLQPNGFYDIDLPEGYDEANVNNFVQPTAPGCVSGGNNPATCIGQNAVAASDNGPATPAYRVSQMPLVTPAFSVSYTPALAETSEKIAKVDLAYRTDGILPFFSRFKTGVQYRKNNLDRYGGAGYVVSSAVGTFGQPGYVPPVVLPRASVRGSYRACQPTAGSSAPGGLPCNYGFVQSTVLATNREGVQTLTPDELRDLFTRTLEGNNDSFFRGYPDKGNLPPAWQGIDTKALFQELGQYQFMNFDCLKTCTANDGNEYDQPFQRIQETIKNVYGMLEFEQNLPLGLVFNGNVGIRGVMVNTAGSALLTLTSVRVTPAFNPTTPTAPAGIISQTFNQNVTLKDKTRDWLPSVNLNLWGFNDAVVFRAYGGKTVARPGLDRLIPGGTCTIDQRSLLTDDDVEQGCTGRVGNPGLKPFTAWNHNLSLEWYPNRDTLISLAYHKLNVKIGNPIAVTKAAQLFAGNSEVDPGTGLPLGDLTFLYPTWENGPGYKRTGWEFGAKTAFTFLPWFLRNTGADFNVSLLKSATTSGLRDPLTGDLMAPPEEQKRFTNLSLWYDDGRLNLRVAYQGRTSRFNCITPCGGTTVDINYPGDQYTNVRLVAPGYNPGVPRFTDGNKFIDAKASFNVNRFLQVYVEGRNLTKEGLSISTGSYVPFADGTKRLMRLAYGGRRFMGGVRLQFGGNE